MPAVVSQTRYDVDWRDSWFEDGACRISGLEPDAWFPISSDPEDSREAREICDECFVKQSCLRYGLSNTNLYGIWGGLDENERRNLIRRSRRSA